MDLPNHLSSIKFNDFVVATRGKVKQVLVRMAHKMTREINKYKNSKADSEEIKKKKLKKARRLATEMKIMKKLKKDTVTKFALEFDKKPESVLNDTKAHLKLKVLVKVSMNAILKKRVEEFREKFPNWKIEIPKVLRNIELKKKGIKLNEEIQKGEGQNMVGDKDSIHKKTDAKGKGKNEKRTNGNVVRNNCESENSEKEEGSSDNSSDSDSDNEVSEKLNKALKPTTPKNKNTKKNSVKVKTSIEKFGRIEIEERSSDDETQHEDISDADDGGESINIVTKKAKTLKKVSTKEKNTTFKNKSNNIAKRKDDDSKTIPFNEDSEEISEDDNEGEFSDSEFHESQVNQNETDEEEGEEEEEEEEEEQEEGNSDNDLLAKKLSDALKKIAPTESEESEIEDEEIEHDEDETGNETSDGDETSDGEGDTVKRKTQLLDEAKNKKVNSRKIDKVDDKNININEKIENSSKKHTNKKDTTKIEKTISKLPNEEKKIIPTVVDEFFITKDNQEYRSSVQPNVVPDQVERQSDFDRRNEFDRRKSNPNNTQAKDIYRKGKKIVSNNSRNKPSFSNYENNKFDRNGGKFQKNARGFEGGNSKPRFGGKQEGGGNNFGKRNAYNIDKVNLKSGGSLASTNEKLHPSWEAKKRHQPAITHFKGKKIKFD